MTRTALIGKGRRIVLEELQSVALYDGIPEIHSVGNETTQTKGKSATLGLDGTTGHKKI